jgi:hypothetical protein
MAQSDDDLETSLPSLADMPLSQLERVRHPVLAMSIRLLLERLDEEQDPLNSFQASI